MSCFSYFESLPTEDVMSQPYHLDVFGQEVDQTMKGLFLMLINAPYTSNASLELPLAFSLSGTGLPSCNQNESVELFHSMQQPPHNAITSSPITPEDGMEMPSKYGIDMAVPHLLVEGLNKDLG